MLGGEKLGQATNALFCASLSIIIVTVHRQNPVYFRPEVRWVVVLIAHPEPLSTRDRKHPGYQRFTLCIPGFRSELRCESLRVDFQFIYPFPE